MSRHPDRAAARQPERTSRVGPHDLDAERALLGVCLLSPTAVAEAREIVTPDEFSEPRYADIFTAIQYLDDRGGAVDPVTVHAALVSLGLATETSVADLLDVAATAPATGSTRSYAEIVGELARKRRLAGAGQEIAAAAVDPTRDADSVLSEAEARLVIAAAEMVDEHRPVSAGDVVAVALARAGAAEERGGGLSGLTTGYSDLDRRLGGMEAGALVVVGARPSMGKTAFTLGIALANAKAGTPTLFSSLEMSRAEIGARLLAMEASVSVDQQRSGQLTTEQWRRLYDAHIRLRDLPLVVDDRSSPTVSDVRLAAKRMQSRQGLGLVVVDYLQLVAPPSSSRPAERREIEVRQTAEGMKAIAKHFGCVVVAAAQLNRLLEGRTDKRPILSDLRESGGIEQAADVVAFLYRDEVYHPDSTEAGTAEVIVRKNRSGPTGIVKLAWLPTLARFADLSRSEAPR
jgi:replicative DNA helicase